MSSTAYADSILFSGSGPGDGVNLSASALFTIDGSTLKIKLQNTGDSSGNSKDVPGNQLTGVFFDLPNGVTLVPLSATVAPGAILQGNNCNPGMCNGTTTNVGGEFAYNTSGNSWDGNHLGNHGVASSGYIGTNAGNMGGPNLDDPDAPNGPNFGIVADNNAFKPNGGLSGVPLIKKEVVLALSLMKDGQAYSGLELTQISNVSFQYGTGFGEPSFKTPNLPPPPSVPEPGVILLAASASAVAWRRRFVKASR